MVCAFVTLSATVFAQDLTIDTQFNVAAADKGNYFTFKGPIRYLLADKDTLDATTGASAKKSTTLFHGYYYDVKGKTTLPGGLRSLFLFGVAPVTQAADDKLTVTKAADGVITINYAHRGTAYQLVTDKTGKFTFPGNFAKKRPVGFIKGAGPQVIGADFSADGTAAKIDWAKVWDAKIASGKEIKAGEAAKTGDISADEADPAAFFAWTGSLQVTFDKNILKINGGLTANKK